jgi:hypothetical protein
MNENTPLVITVRRDGDDIYTADVLHPGGNERFRVEYLPGISSAVVSRGATADEAFQRAVHDTLRALSYHAEKSEGLPDRISIEIRRVRE